MHFIIINIIINNNKLQFLLNLLTHNIIKFINYLELLILKVMKKIFIGLLLLS